MHAMSTSIILSIAMKIINRQFIKTKGKGSQHNNLVRKHFMHIQKISCRKIKKLAKV